MRSVEALLERDDLDAVAICTPAALHEAQVYAAVARGIHVFCEKPLTWGQEGRQAASAEALVRACAARNLLLYENTQWIYTLDTFQRAYGPLDPARVQAIAMELAPVVPDHESMVREAFPHVASLVLALGSCDEVRDVHINCVAPGMLHGMATTLNAGGYPMQVIFRFANVTVTPRPAAYAINGRWLRRRVEAGYRIGFETPDNFYPSEDPLAISVRTFLEQVRRVKSGGAAKSALATVSRAGLTDRIRSAVLAALRVRPIARAP
jgi:hypothetical protein